MTRRLNSGGVTSALPYVVEKGLPALIAFATSVGAMPARKAAPNNTPCGAVSIFRDRKNEATKKTKYPDERNKFGNRKSTGRPIRRPTRPASSRRCRRCSLRKSFAVRKPASAHTAIVGATEELALAGLLIR